MHPGEQRRPRACQQKGRKVDTGELGNRVPQRGKLLKKGDW